MPEQRLPTRGREAPWPTCTSLPPRPAPTACRQRSSLKGQEYQIIDAEERPDLAEKFGIMQAPTLVIVRGRHRAEVCQRFQHPQVCGAESYKYSKGIRTGRWIHCICLWGLCAWQRVYVSLQERISSCLWAPPKKEDYNLDKVFQVEKWIFLVDAACSLGVGMNRFPDVVENILLVVFESHWLPMCMCLKVKIPEGK